MVGEQHHKEPLSKETKLKLKNILCFYMLLLKLLVLEFSFKTKS